MNRIILMSILMFILMNYPVYAIGAEDASRIIDKTKDLIDSSRDLSLSLKSTAEEISLESFIKTYIKEHSKASDEDALSIAQSSMKYGKEHNIDPLLITSIIQVESTFNRRAISSANARGLMQLLPSTVKYIAELTGTKYSYSKLDEIDYNISLGTAYYAYLRDHFSKRDTYGHDIDFIALVAYNRGPGNASRESSSGRLTTWYGDKVMSVYNEMHNEIENK